jgi:lysine 2,3-aminomutase
MSLENQAPIIKDVNDDPDALRIHAARAQARRRQQSLLLLRPRHRRIPRVQRADRDGLANLNESQKGLSGVETHARLSITHYKGKTEVAAVTNEPIPGIPGTENGVVIFKILRNAHALRTAARSASSGRNPDAIWFDDYADRVIFDEAGLFDYARVVEK